MLNIRVVIGLVGIILLIFGGLMLIPFVWSMIYETSESFAFLYSILTILITGFTLSVFRPKEIKFGKREGFLIVTLSWLALCFAGTVPYLYSGVAPSFIDAVFESTSGLTTTGASIFTDIEALPKSILIWRSMTQWIGGMGIIVLTVAVLPLLGISGIELFVAESPGPKTEKIHPKIKETAKRLWLIYVGLTLLLGLILHFVGNLSLYEAFNHALTTMSTGGFSTRNDSAIGFDPMVQYILIFFMFLAGANYTIIYFGLMGRLKRVWASEEFRTYFAGVLSLVLLCGIYIHYQTDYPIEESIRNAAFQIISLLTTTGYVSADYTSWSNSLTMLFFFLLFTGACAGSTSGGIKVVRHLAFAKNMLLEFKRLLHPRAIIRMKIDGRLVAPRILTHILVFLLVYLMIIVFGTLVMSVILSGSPQPLLTSFGSVATCLGNVGPAIGAVGPVDNFSAIPGIGKIFLSLLMVIGRLELFTVLIILTPYFWRSN